MTKEQIIRKLTSRKLWVAVVGIVVGVATAFGITDNDYAPIVGTIGSIMSAVAYILGESFVDSNNKVELIETVTNSIGFVDTNDEGVGEDA